MDDGYLRIGEFSQRVGVSPDLLRAWERRYGLLEPSRSAGGFRLYSDTDVARVERMSALLQEGRSAAQAARLARETVTREGGEAVQASDVTVDAARARLAAALDAFDEQAVHRVLDDLLATLHLETVLREVVVPHLHWVGEQWAAGRLTVGQEHFASGLLRGRLLAAARGWGVGIGPRAVLAAPAGEEHDLGLIVFGLCLWRRGWRITFLGADTPMAAVHDAVERLDARLVVLASVRADRLEAVRDDLVRLRASVPLALGGPGASAGLAADVGAHHLAVDPVTAAAEVTTIPSAGG